MTSGRRLNQTVHSSPSRLFLLRDPGGGSLAGVRVTIKGRERRVPANHAVSKKQNFLLSSLGDAEAAGSPPTAEPPRSGRRPIRGSSDTYTSKSCPGGATRRPLPEPLPQPLPEPQGARYACKGPRAGPCLNLKVTKLKDKTRGSKSGFCSETAPRGYTHQQGMGRERERERP